LSACAARSFLSKAAEMSITLGYGANVAALSGSLRRGI
jgi:hypothetical protein